MKPDLSDDESNLSTSSWTCLDDESDCSAELVDNEPVKPTKSSFEIVACKKTPDDEFSEVKPERILPPRTIDSQESLSLGKLFVEAAPVASKSSEDDGLPVPVKKSKIKKLHKKSKKNQVKLSNQLLVLTVLTALVMHFSRVPEGSNSLSNYNRQKRLSFEECITLLQNDNLCLRSKSCSKEYKVQQHCAKRYKYDIETLKDLNKQQKKVKKLKRERRINDGTESIDHRNDLNLNNFTWNANSEAELNVYSKISNAKSHDLGKYPVEHKNVKKLKDELWYSDSVYRLDSPIMNSTQRSLDHRIKKHKPATLKALNCSHNPNKYIKRLKADKNAENINFEAFCHIYNNENETVSKENARNNEKKTKTLRVNQVVSESEATANVPSVSVTTAVIPAPVVAENTLTENKSKMTGPEVAIAVAKAIHALEEKKKERRLKADTSVILRTKPANINFETICNIFNKENGSVPKDKLRNDDRKIKTSRIDEFSAEPKDGQEASDVQPSRTKPILTKPSSKLIASSQDIQTADVFAIAAQAIKEEKKKRERRLKTVSSIVLKTNKLLKSKIHHKSNEAVVDDKIKAVEKTHNESSVVKSPEKDISVTKPSSDCARATVHVIPEPLAEKTIRKSRKRPHDAEPEPESLSEEKRAVLVLKEPALVDENNNSNDLSTPKIITSHSLVPSSLNIAEKPHESSNIFNYPNKKLSTYENRKYLEEFYDYYNKFYTNTNALEKVHDTVIETDAIDNAIKAVDAEIDALCNKRNVLLQLKHTYCTATKNGSKLKEKIITASDPNVTRAPLCDKISRFGKELGITPSITSLSRQIIDDVIRNVHVKDFFNRTKDYVKNLFDCDRISNVNLASNSRTKAVDAYTNSDTNISQKQNNQAVIDEQPQKGLDFPAQMQALIAINSQSLDCDDIGFPQKEYVLKRRSVKKNSRNEF